MPKPDYSTWLTKQQAAEAIGVSTKTIEQLAKAKKIEQASRRRPETGARVSVYHPDDVARIRKQRNPGAEPFVLPPPEPQDPEPPAETKALSTQFADRFFQLLSKASQNSQNRSEVRLSERLFLTIPEAADYSGLPQSHLRKLITSGKLEAMRTGAGWRIRRTDLEKL